MERIVRSKKVNFTTPPDNGGVSFEDIKSITHRRRVSDYVGENDIM